jgi:hypothetical protein
LVVGEAEQEVGIGGREAACGALIPPTFVPPASATIDGVVVGRVLHYRDP